MTKVLIITYYWPPSGGAGVQRWLKLSKYLNTLGIVPLVLTVDEQYASYPQTDRSLEEEVPSSVKVFKTKSREVLQLFPKKKIPYGGFTEVHKGGWKQQLMTFVRGNFFLPDPRQGWNRYAYKKALKIIREEGVEAVITSSPPHSTQLIGMKLKRKLGIHWIADLRDPWTDIYYAKELKQTWLARQINAGYERKVVEEADYLTVVSSEIKRRFALKSGRIDEEKIRVIPNGYDPEDFEKPAPKKSDHFTIAYTGTMNDSYRPEILFKTVHDLLFEMNIREIRVKMAGSFSHQLLELIDKYNLHDHVEVLPPVPHAESVSLLTNASILFLVIPDVKGAKGILTGKLFEYLAARKPILCLGPRNGDAAAIIAECKAGETFSRSDLFEVKAFFLKEIECWKEGKPALEEDETYHKYSREVQARQFKSLIDAR